ncbi:hypothetical protein DFH29DRAFT_441140 [Suillus ampliporus]|nr:hypothetical protein DFH29DRAFT_441140 [Suillus ampliporus]
MAFSEVVHYVARPTGWPEPVCDIASLLAPLHCADWPAGDEYLASPSKPSEPLAARESPATRSYTAMDFQGLIDSTAAGLSALAGLPRYGGERPTVPLWSQLIHALAKTLSSEVLILEDTPFIMPRAQNIATQPTDLIDGHAGLLVAHAIFSTHRNHPDRSSYSPGSRGDEDESMYSVDSDSCNGSVDSLDLPLQAHMLPGRGRCFSAVVPILLVADARNIVPLLCSALYQRHVWGIRQPVVGLCCSSTDTIASAIFGWLDSDQSEEGHMPVAHLALAADDHLDPLMGVFDFADPGSAICLAQFILGLRSHFTDIKGATSIEVVDSLTPLQWRSDLPDFETQFGGRLDERVASWTHHVHVHTSSSESSSSTPRTPSPLSDPALVSYENMSPQDLHTIVEDDQVDDANTRVHRLPKETRATGEKRRGRASRPPSLRDSSQRSSSPSRQPVLEVERRSRSTSSRAPSRYPNSKFAALSDGGLVDDISISNWLFERHAFSVGRISLPSTQPEHESGINELVQIYDQMTAFTWSEEVQTILSDRTVDSSVLDVRSELFATAASRNRQSSAINIPLEDIKFISSRLSALLHAVKGARDCEGGAKLYGANEADRRHEWDALLMNFFQPVPGQRDVLLERTLNFARNLAVDDPSFSTRAADLTGHYRKICIEQQLFEPDTEEDLAIFNQAAAALTRANQFTSDITRRRHAPNFVERIAYHSRREPDNGTCNAVLVVPCSGAITAMLQHLPDSKEQEAFLATFILIRDLKPEKNDSSFGQGNTSYQIGGVVSHTQKPASNSQLQVPSSHVSESKRKKNDRDMLENVFFVHPDGTQTTDRLSEQTPFPEPGIKDLLLPVLLSEYKKRDGSAISKAANQMRTYLVSAITFLSALGVTDEPVFGLVVNGTRGAVTMAWMKGEKIYIMERNVRYYDITDPLQALQFVWVLLRLARHGQRLRGLFEQKQNALHMSISLKTLKPWSKLAQGDSEEGGGLEAVHVMDSEQVGEQGQSSKKSGK